MQREAYSLSQGTLAQLSVFLTLHYFETAESVCQFIQGITVNEEGRKEGDDILRIMTSFGFVVPDPDPP